MVSDVKRPGRIRFCVCEWERKIQMVRVKCKSTDEVSSQIRIFRTLAELSRPHNFTIITFLEAVLPKLCFFFGTNSED